MTCRLSQPARPGNWQMALGAMQNLRAVRRAGWPEGTFGFIVLFDYEGRMRLRTEEGEMKWSPSAADFAARDWELC